MSDSNGRAVSYAWDSGGLLQWMEDSLSTSNKNRSEVVRDAKARVTEILRKLKQEPAGGGTPTNVTYKDVLVYDEWDRVRRVDRFGKTTAKITDRRYGWDTLGNLTWFQDSEGKVRQEHFDSVGRTWKAEIYPQPGPGGDPVIELEQEFEDTNLADYGTDGFGGALDTTTLSLAVKRKDGRDKETVYLYDMLGRLVERRVPGYSGSSRAFRWSYKYAGGGPLEKWMDGNGHTVFVDRDDNLLRATKRRVVPNVSGVPLSLMTGFEEWNYDDDGRKVARRTRAGAWATGNPDWLIDELRSYDSLGRLHSEAFGFGESADAGHQSKTTKTIGYGYSYSASPSGDDTGFRRSMSFDSGWSFEFDPDGAGKQKEMRLKGPGDSSFFQAAIWRYEGARAHARDFLTTSGASFFRTTTDVDDLGYLKQLTTVFNPSSPTLVFDQLQSNDKEGNFVWRKFDKIQSGQYTANRGDWYGLDGHARLKEARLGVEYDANGPKLGQSDPYDKKLEYALDVAQNRTSVTENGVPGSYTVSGSSNRYDATPYSGVMLYDGNGNLAFDGYRLYVYDYLDRLCEIWDYVEGTQGMTAGDGYKSTAWAQRRPPLSLTRAEASAIAARLQRHLSTMTATRYKGVSEINQLARNEKIEAKNVAQESVTATFVLRALYGYDSFNRRVFRATTDEGVRWNTWNGWQMAEEWEETGGPTFTPRKAFFDGLGIDEHLGYATYNGSTWSRGSERDRYSWSIRHSQCAEGRSFAGSPVGS